MDFDDLDDAEALAGPTPEQRAEELVSKAMPAEKPFPFATSKCLAPGGKMKMLYLMGGGVNEKIGNMQVANLMKEVPDGKAQYEWTIWPGVHKVPLGWNHDYSLKSFGPDFYVYYERLPHANCQWETWEGIEKSIAEFKALLKEKGPFDGVVGFDMGGELLVHLAGMAQEGDEDLKGCWRFMILFTTSAPKHLSPLGPKRLKSPLRIPSIVSWSEKDANHSFVNFEELALFIHPDYREVIVHPDGHKPPKLTKEMSETQRFVAFLQAMRAGDKFQPSDHTDNKIYAGLWLPLLRVQPAALPSGARKRLLLVQDPLGAHDLDQRAEVIADLIKKGEIPEVEGIPFEKGGSVPRIVERTKVAAGMRRLTSEGVKAKNDSLSSDGRKIDGLDIQAVEYSKAHKEIAWTCTAEDVPSQQFGREEVVRSKTEELDLVARRVADEVMSTITVASEDAIGIVGIGIGALIGLEIAKLLVREKKMTPAAVWVVDPPTVLPAGSTTRPGSLVDTPMYSFVHTNAPCGPPWRYEVSTCGPFVHATYEDEADLLAKILDSFRSC